MNIVDNIVSFFSPRAGAERLKYRTAEQLLTRRYEAAGGGRRGANWTTRNTGPNAVNETNLSRLRARSRDMERNNLWARSAIGRLANNVVGTGIVPNPKNSKVMKLWRSWAETKECDFYGQMNIYGIQKQAMKAIARDGEVIIRLRRVKGKTLPIKLQVQEVDVLDSLKNYKMNEGGEIIQGVEFDADKRRVAYWLYDNHPEENGNYTASRRIPVEDVIHVYDVERPGQVRGVPFLATALLRLKDYDEYEDAELVRQKIAACFAAFVQDTNPDAAETNEDGLDIERLEPGIIEMLPAGKSVTFASPPTTQNYDSYGKSVLRGAAGGIGLSYEALSGDYSNVNFSSGRMGWIEMQRNVESWQYNMLVPMLCDSVWEWFISVGVLAGKIPLSAATPTLWTPPRREMIDPSKEIAAQINAVRGGIMSLSEVHRQNGYDSAVVLDEMAADNKRIDTLGLILDSDARKTMKAGVTQAFLKTPTSAAEFTDPPVEDNTQPPAQ